MLHDGRPVLACRHCGYAFAGRGVYGDHGLAKLNLARHEEACLRQQAERAAKAARAESRRQRRAYSKAGADPPMAGQLPLPGTGAQEVV